MAKADVAIGFIDIAQADFVEFNHYTADSFCELGAMDVSFACKYEGELFEVVGTFVVGSDDLLTVNVSSVSTFNRDDDGDIVNEDHTVVTGTCLTLPYSCVLAIYTTCFDAIEHEQDMMAVESII